MTAPRRTLEDMIGELAGSLLPQLQGSQVRPVSLDLSLPVEAQVVDAGDGLRLVADMPRLHTRTDFDMPIGRLTLSLGTIAAKVLP